MAASAAPFPISLADVKKAKGGSTIRKMLYNNTEKPILAVDKKKSETTV